MCVCVCYPWPAIRKDDINAGPAVGTTGNRTVLEHRSDPEEESVEGIRFFPRGTTTTKLARYRFPVVDRHRPVWLVSPTAHELRSPSAHEITAPRRPRRLCPFVRSVSNESPNHPAAIGFRSTIAARRTFVRVNGTTEIDPEMF